jgi:hypothetical protein
MKALVQDAPSDRNGAASYDCLHRLLLDLRHFNPVGHPIALSPTSRDGLKKLQQLLGGCFPRCFEFP